MDYREEVAKWLGAVVKGYEGGATGLARDSKVDRSTIYDFLNQKQDANDGHLKALATAAGVPVPRRTLTLAPPTTTAALARQVAVDAAHLADLLTRSAAGANPAGYVAEVRAYREATEQAPPRPRKRKGRPE